MESPEAFSFPDVNKRIFQKNTEQLLRQHAYSTASTSDCHVHADLSTAEEVQEHESRLRESYS